MKYEDFEYEIVKNEIVITNYVGNDEDIVIPAEIKGYPVTRIGNCAFRGHRNLESIVIPDSVISIGDCAFEDCSSLADIIIPDSITSIGKWAFGGCSSLTSVIIPDSVTILDYSVFYDCDTLINVITGNRVTHIAPGAFRNCSSLTNITIPDSIISIGYCAFYGCNSLKSTVANYKAFKLYEGKLVCRDYMYTENEWSKELNEIEICEKGYHYCNNLFNIFNNYSGELDKDITIYICDVGDKIKRKGETGKYCTNKIKPVKRLCREDVIKILNGGILG